MFEITSATAAEYLRASGRISAGEAIEATELAGGVSNVVLLVTHPERGERLVLKQARGQLRVKEEWLCPVERIWREVEMLRVCGELLRNAARGKRDNDRSSAALFQPGVPDVLWDDPANYCYAMTAAPARNRTWKEMLLAPPTTTP